MRNSPWFNLLFMLIITAVLTGILSGVYEYARPVIRSNEELGIKQAQLYAFNIDIPTDISTDVIEKLYDEKIKTEQFDGETIYISRTADDQPQAYGFSFAGGALWGEVEGVLVLSPDLNRIIGIAFTEQNETPGLGGMIDEPEFKEQFRGVDLNSEGDALIYSTSTRQGQVDAITGATLTSNSVLSILNNKIEQIRKAMGGV
ncbi:MAG: FMN-binding protein [Clostridiales bacterium]|nr:FMN-binding protein [Clostridiales bacterium]